MIPHYRGGDSWVELALMRRMWIAAGLLSGGCPSDPPPACTTVETACAPQYVPTFDNVYANTLAMDCGASRGACHSASGEGGMSLVDPATAHASLLARVSPGDPACSEVIVRTHSPGADYQMPPGTPLSEAERCALLKWVEAGAPGPGEPLP